MWDSLVWIWGSEFVLCVGQFGSCLEIKSVCCVWESLERDWGIDFCCVWESLGRVWGDEFVLCVGQFGVGLGE